MSRASERRRRAAGRATSGGYFGIPHQVARSSGFASCSAYAIKLLVDIGLQFRGANNGDLAATWKLMHARGWRSRETLRKALVELLDAGLIELTRQGGKHRCSLYGLTWWPIHECGGKLDVIATLRPSDRWKGQNAGTPGVSIMPARRVNGSGGTTDWPTRRASQP